MWGVKGERVNNHGVQWSKKWCQILSAMFGLQMCGCSVCFTGPSSLIFEATVYASHRIRVKLVVTLLFTLATFGAFNFFCAAEAATAAVVVAVLFCM